MPFRKGGEAAQTGRREAQGPALGGARGHPHGAGAPQGRGPRGRRAARGGAAAVFAPAATLRGCAAPRRPAAPAGLARGGPPRHDEAAVCRGRPAGAARARTADEPHAPGPVEKAHVAWRRTTSPPASTRSARRTSTRCCAAARPTRGTPTPRSTPRSTAASPSASASCTSATRPCWPPSRATPAPVAAALDAKRGVRACSASATRGLVAKRRDMDRLRRPRRPRPRRPSAGAARRTAGLRWRLSRAERAPAGARRAAPGTSRWRGKLREEARREALRTPPPSGGAARARGAGAGPRPRRRGGRRAAGRRPPRGRRARGSRTRACGPRGHAYERATARAGQPPGPAAASRRRAAARRGGSGPRAALGGRRARRRRRAYGTAIEFFPAAAGYRRALPGPRSRRGGERAQ